MHGNGKALLAVEFPIFNFKTGTKKTGRLFFKGRAWHMRITALDAMYLIESLNYGKKKQCSFRGETWTAYKSEQAAIAA